MRRLLVLTVLPLLAGITPIQTPPLLDKQAQTGVPDKPKSARGSRTIVCGMSAPATFAEWWMDADAIVRVRVEAHHSHDEHWHPAHEPNIMTEVLVTVQDVFKAHPGGVGAGATMTITHPGGTIVREDGPDTHETNGFPPPAIGTEWFYFSGGTGSGNGSGFATWIRARSKLSMAWSYRRIDVG